MFKSSTLGDRIKRYLGVAQIEDLSDLQNGLDQAKKTQPQIAGLADKLIPLLSSIDRALVDLEESKQELKLQVLSSKRLSEDLLKAKRYAEGASKTKSEFLANMSHEIRTPMNGILGMTDAVLETDLTSNQRDYLNTVKLSANALLVIVNDILDYSKIEAGKLDIENIEFSLHDLVNETLKPFAAVTHEKQLDLIYRISPALSRNWRGDPGRIRQIINNLVGNAVKFTSTGEIKIEVLPVPGAAGTPAIEFAVTDTGVGIAFEKQTLIFEAFSQADTSTTRKYGGTGLGLTICAKLAELMGGTIQLQSQLGLGSRFAFTVALEASDPNDESMLSTVHLPHLHVLLVEHNTTQLEWLTDQMKAWGIQTMPAQCGAQALTLIENARQKPDFVLIDSDLEDMSGFDLAKTLDDRLGTAKRTLMMLGASKPAASIECCKTLGVAGWTIRPTPYPDLLNSILLMLGTPSALTPNEVSDQQKQVVQIGLNILVVEDNVVNQKVAMQVLGKLGHTIELVENGAQAVQRVHAQAFDVVLMDLQMPVMGGLEATKNIRQAEQHSEYHQLIIAMTANAMEGDREKCIDAGMDGYVSKPINKAKLTEEIDRVISKAKARSIWKLSTRSPLSLL